jgi:hypothetical protein
VRPKPSHNLTYVSSIAYVARVEPIDATALQSAAAATVRAELGFARPDGTVDGAVVTPLTADGDVVVALPYAERALAEALTAADAVVLVLSDARLTLGGWRALAATGRMQLEPDPEGARFRDGLVEDELRKYPPARLLANSLMDRRENWWFMPRLICRLTALQDVRPVSARRSPERHGTLVWADAAGLRADTVEVAELGGDRRVRSLGGARLAGAADPACLVRHDCSMPDLERRSVLRERGRLESDVLRVAEREGAVALPGPPGLLVRIRQHRALARACRRELARAGREPPVS